VAILSANMPNWAITYFGITFMGAVVVPILPNFSPIEIANILEHSESKAVFVSSGLISKISEFKSSFLTTRIQMEDFTVIKSDKPSLEFMPGSLPMQVYNVEEDSIASIIYTSGTTGRSKGVMLTHKNISFNAIKGRRIQYLDENDRILSVLPLSHTYENTLGLILPMLSGSCVYYLRKPPTPAVLIPALEIVKPTAMLTVPLIIEKIYFNKILPTFNEKMILKFLYKISFIRKLMNRVAGKKLMKTFGGQIKCDGL
jgi:long-chain acyl-CoA synthetase